MLITYIFILEAIIVFSLKIKDYSTVAVEIPSFPSIQHGRIQNAHCCFSFLTTKISALRQGLQTGSQGRGRAANAHGRCRTTLYAKQFFYIGQRGDWARLQLPAHKSIWRWWWLKNPCNSVTIPGLPVKFRKNFAFASTFYFPVSANSFDVDWTHTLRCSHFPTEFVWSLWGSC